jgi:molecular chaperone DnaK
MPTYVGIDLGTTNSVVAARNAYGRPEVLANRDGRNITPSVIYFGSEPPAVGDEAKEWARLGNEEIASFFKPHMGSPLYKLQFHGRDYDATDLSSLVLKRLKQDAEARLNTSVDHAVVTVPAYFADAQRKATIEAGRLAGLNVARIINEPTAAALAYGLQKSGVEETVLIYDLGGGTFDVTVARITPDEVSVLSTAGDRDLGGKDWDDLIATYLAEKFAADTGLDPLDDPVALNEVLTLSEQAKWALSDRTSARVTLQIGQQRKSYELSRLEFEAMTFALMDRTRRLTEEALEEAGLTWKRLSGVLLVGGSTRMPMVRSYVKEMAGQDPRAGVNVDEVVALGAAIQAAIEAGVATGDAVPKFSLAGARRVVDVMSHSLGAVAVSPDGQSYVNDVIIGRNLPIPVEDSKTYLHTTHGGRNETLEIYLTQGESTRPLDCSVLGKYVFTGIQTTDAEVKVDVKMSYDVNGVVQVRAIQRDTGHALQMKVEPVPDDLSWLGRPPSFESARAPADPTRIYLLIDISASMAGTPLMEAQQAARAFLDKCDFTATEVGLISFSDEVTLQAEATDNVRKVQAALVRLEPDGTTNLSDALELARQRLNRLDRTRYIVVLTDGYPDAAESAVEQAAKARGEGIEIVAIGMGDADLGYLRRLASTEEGSIFARQGELVGAFGHIAKIISEGGRSLRKLS